MKNFTYENRTKIIFGKDSEQKLSEEIDLFGASKILLHYGSDRIKKDGLYDKIVEQITKAGANYVALGGVVPNPQLELVKKGIEICKKEDVDLILAVGGGSVIDSAKGIAAGTVYNGDVWDFYESKAVCEEAIPVATVLTIPAAGSESSANTVITNIKTGRKLAFGSEALRPIFSILNPELTMSLPDYQTACGISDMLAHVFERYFVNVDNVVVTDELCLAHMRSIMEIGLKVIGEPDNYDYRAELMLAGMIAHNGWLNTGRGGEWTSHQIEHELSAEYNIAHGAGLSIIFPAWMKTVYKDDTELFSDWARDVMGIVEKDDEKASMLGIEKLEEFYKQIGMPIRMSEAKITDDRYEKMAMNLLNKAETIGKFKKFNKKEIIEIYELAK